MKICRWGFILISSFYLFFTNNLCLGQKKNVKFTHIDIKKGLSNNSVNCILRDTRGFIWIATSDGLNRYDGNQLEVFAHEKNDSLSLGSNLTYSLLEDSSKNLWVGSQAGLQKFDYQKNNFVKNYIINEPTRALTVNKEGEIWAGTDDALYKFTQEKDSFIMQTQIDYNILYSNYNSVSSLAFDSKDRLWVGTFHGGVVMYDKKLQQFKHFEHDPNNIFTLSGNDIYSLFIDSKDNIWVATINSGLNKWNEKNQNFIKVEPNKETPFSTQLLTVIEEDPDGNLWIGTDGGGLNIFNPVTKENDIFIKSPKKPEGINNNVIRNIHYDDHGGMWIGTYRGGINFSNLINKGIIHIKDLPFTDDNQSITSVLEDSLGNFWIGSDGGSMCYFDRVKNIYHNPQLLVSKKSQPLPKKILSLTMDNKGFIWIGTYLEGLVRYDPRKKEVRYYLNNPNDENSIANNVIWKIIEDQNKKLWLGTNGGLDHFDPSNGNFKHFNFANSNITDNQIYSLHLDVKDRLWIGTQNGLNMIKPGQNSFTRYQDNMGIKNEIPNDWVVTIASYSPDTLLLGTVGGGLILFDLVGNKFFGMNEEKGLSNNNVSGIIVEDSLLWISTNKGICKYVLSANNFEVFFHERGQHSNQFNVDAAIKSSKGELILGGTDGLNIIYPDRITINNFIPKLAFTNFKIFNEEVSHKDKNSPLKNHISETKEIVVPYTKSVLTFGYTAFNYIQSDRNQFSYFLENFDKTWNMVGNQKTATYTNLNPGNYIFKVKASNNDGVWNNKGISLKLTITPPFWQTWWFKGVIIVLVALLLKFREKAIRERERKKSRTKRLITELESKALIAQMNPHFSFNCLSSIQQLIAKNKLDEASSYLNKFSKLMRMVLECADKKWVSLEMEGSLLKAYLELEAIRLQGNFNHKIIFEEGLDLEDHFIPSLMIQPIIENSIKHGLTPKQGDKKLTIRFKEKEGNISCEVEDNGIGRAASRKLQQSKISIPHQSIGIKLITDRLELFKKENAFGGLEIIDLLDENEIGVGTKVIIDLPTQ